MLYEVQKIVDKVHTLLKDENLQKKGKLPSSAYFLNADEIVCFPRAFGDSRYPYAYDGLTLWAYSSGNVKIEESAFNVLLDFDHGKEPTLAFFFGVEQEGGYFPVSITGAGKQPVENEVSRYTVYTPDCAYYITECPQFIGAVKMTVDCNKNVWFTAFLQNKTQSVQNTYLSAFFNCILSHAGHESFEGKWYRSCKKTDGGFLCKVTEYWGRTTCLNHFGKLKRDYQGEIYSTTSLADYKGGMNNQLISALPLRTGVFEQCKPFTSFTEPSIAGDIIPLCLQATESVTVAYTLSVADDEAQAVSNAEKPFSREKMQAVYADIPPVSFDTEYGVNNDTLACFMKNVLRQVEFCSRAKNYAGSYIGIRDIFQQLECAMIWIPEYCRKKMIEALGNIDENGRPPRQYSYSRSKDVPPAMDLRKYIDQGVWVISTFYRYISLTGDFSVLDEICGYYKLSDDSVAFSTQKDSVLCHLLRIADYLLSNLDEQTNCLHILYGDWNDAVDGLGKTTDEDKDFGTGVSVMATMQLYQNLNELCEILCRKGGYEEYIERYEASAKAILAGLQKYAVDTNEKGEKKVLHGWGDKLSYKIGSFCDNDGFSRDSATSNAFWVLSGVNNAVDMKEYIVKAYERLESKYGIKTFEPYFALDNKEVGRITRLPKGTAENGAVYIHATLFAIWSLFEMGEYEKAWEQIVKILPLTHTHISTTPFVMPNSYLYNEEMGIDGESMSDWFTGSGCVLGKILFFCIFGVQANIDGVKICPAVSKKAKTMQTSLKLKGGKITVQYSYKGVKKRVFTVNGKQIEGESLYFTNEEIKGKEILVTVCD